MRAQQLQVAISETTAERIDWLIDNAHFTTDTAVVEAAVECLYMDVHRELEERHYRHELSRRTNINPTDLG